MLTLILGIAIITLIIFLVLRVRYAGGYNAGDFTVNDFFMLMCWVSGIGCICLIIAICYLAPKVATESVIDSKIIMYQEENTNIEQDIDKIVKAYLEHEHDTFADLKTEENSITLVTLFPELKSDTLVQQQLEIYVANNAKIKSLKEEKIDLAKIRWLLYFGR